ncbi:hypothetical protein GOP47_0013809 [Adiantum capillus-veneris]|uniref:Sugar phosphate transporter domain-containing protein n=1 Tax=Adiantum capillus-veneris TaxID=13818 RepID=A0A9D4ZDK6_ADICA|nr:hypothetical protein GOP47_0013809 [Adiantum capillus-veneris]
MRRVSFDSHAMQLRLDTLPLRQPDSSLKGFRSPSRELSWQAVYHGKARPLRSPTYYRSPCSETCALPLGTSHKTIFKVCAKAYEAGQSDAFPEGSSEAAIDMKSESGPEGKRRVKIGIYFATWWALNVVFNIYNKKVLNAFPYPWLTSTLSLAAGSAIMLASWATRLVETPDVDIEFWKGLAPVALAHTIGHVAATVSMSKVAVSFTHIIKSAEPAFSVLVSRFLLGEHFPLPVYLSLIPVIGGCGLAALTELNFNMTGFMGAMISNLAFVFRNIFSKKGMKKGKSVGGMNYYACLSMLSLVFLTPFAFAVEGPKMWATGWQQAVNTVGPHVFWWVVAQSVFYHLYNQVSYMSLDEISPLTFSIGNTMKRSSRSMPLVQQLPFWAPFCIHRQSSENGTAVHGALGGLFCSLFPANSFFGRLLDSCILEANSVA